MPKTFTCHVYAHDGMSAFDHKPPATSPHTTSCYIHHRLIIPALSYSNLKLTILLVTIGGVEFRIHALRMYTTKIK